METKTVKITGHINLTSLAIGFLLAVCLMLASGAYSGSGPAEPGPYQIAACGSGVFVTDTRTGQTWQLGTSENIDYGTPMNRKSLKKYITPMVE